MEKKSIRQSSSDKQAVGGKILLSDGTEIPTSKAYKASGFLFVSGQLPFESDGTVSTAEIAHQTTLCLNSIKQILAIDNLVIEDLVKLTIWLSNKQDFSGFNQAYQQFMGEHRPSRSTVCAELMLPNALIEIEAIAAY